MHLINRIKQYQKHVVLLNTLHIFNDGYAASMLLLLPFIAKDMHISLTAVGVLGTIENSLGFFLALPSGYLAKKFGGMRALIYGCLLSGFGYALTGFSATYVMLFPAFILGGIAFGIFHPISLGLVTRLSAKETRGKALGDFTAIGDLGRIGIGALLTIVIAAIGWRFTSLLYAVIALLVGFIAFFLYKKSDEVKTTQDVMKAVRLRELLLHKGSFFVHVTAFFDSFASNTLFIFLPFLLLFRGSDPALLGSLTAFFFIGNFAGKLFLGRLVDKYKSTTVFIVSETLMALLIVFMASVTSLPLLIISSIILGVFTKGTVPAMKMMVSESAEHHGNFEKAFGANTMISRVGSTISPIILGFVSDHAGIVAAFYVLAAAALIAVIPAFGFHRTKK